MGRKKKVTFKLNPEWMLKEPLDFEYNKYTLLDYIQKCEKKFDNFEIYPDFVELSLHLANLQSLIKENTILLTNKKFESCDDEILLKELYPKKPRSLTKEEEEELEKTIRFSGAKLFDAFNLGKSIWNIVFDNVDVTLKKNKDFLSLGKGFVFYHQKETNKIFLWEFESKKTKGELGTTKNHIKLIFEGEAKDFTLNNLILTFSNWHEDKLVTELPIFEVKTKQKFPMEQALVPIIKRKISSLIFQSINTEKIK